MYANNGSPNNANNNFVNLGKINSLPEEHMYDLDERIFDMLAIFYNLDAI